MNIEPGFEVIEDPKAPKGRRIVRIGGKPAENADDVALSDDELRAAIQEATGKAPHHKAGREKLLKQYNSIAQEETASNGLTRREIEADLTAMNVEFDPRDPLEDLAALRDLEREQRS